MTGQCEMNSGKLKSKLKQPCSNEISTEPSHLIYQDSCLEVSSKSIKCTVVTVQKLESSSGQAAEPKKRCETDEDSAQIDASKPHKNTAIENPLKNDFQSLERVHNTELPFPASFPDHLFTLKYSFLDEAIRERTSDLTVIIQEERFKIHCYLLGVVSAYVQELIRNDKLPTGCELILENVPAQGFTYIVHWMYTAQLQITLDNALPIYVAANLLSIPQVSKSCHQFLESKVTDIKRELNLYETVLKAEVRAPSREQKGEFRSLNFLNYSVDEICEFISFSSRKEFSETDVFKTTLNWLLHDWQKRRHHEDRVMNAIAFERISKREMESLMLLAVESVYCENSFWAHLIKILHDKVRERHQRTSSRTSSIEAIISEISVHDSGSHDEQPDNLSEKYSKTSNGITDIQNDSQEVQTQAAIKIQALYHGWRTRKLIQLLRLKEVQTQAAIKIQALYRGWRMRKLIQGLMRRPDTYNPSVSRLSSTVSLNDSVGQCKVAFAASKMLRSESKSNSSFAINSAADVESSESLPQIYDNACVFATHLDRTFSSNLSIAAKNFSSSDKQCEATPEDIAAALHDASQQSSSALLSQQSANVMPCTSDGSTVTASIKTTKQLNYRATQRFSARPFSKKARGYIGRRKHIIDTSYCRQHGHPKKAQEQDLQPLILQICTQDQKVFDVHSSQLAKHNPYFHKILTEKKMPLPQELVLHVNANSFAVEAIVDWMYTNKINITSKCACDIYLVAVQLCLPDILKACQVYWQNSNSLEEIISLLKFGKEHDFHELVHGAKELILRKFSQTDCKMDTFAMSSTSSSSSLDHNTTNEERKMNMTSNRFTRTEKHTELPTEHQLRDDAHKIVYALQQVQDSEFDNSDVSEATSLKDETSNESVIGDSLFSGSEESIPSLCQAPFSTESMTNLNGPGYSSVEDVRATTSGNSPTLEVVVVGDGGGAEKSIADESRATMDSEIASITKKQCSLRATSGPSFYKKSPKKSPLWDVLEPGVLSLGGVSKDTQMSCEMPGRQLYYFNFKDGIWKEVGSLSKGRYYPTACVHKKKLYMAGGYDPSSSQVGTRLVPSKEMWCLDLQIMKWTRMASMKKGRTYHILLALDSDRLVAIGGTDHENRALNTVECFVPSKNRWSDFAPLVVPRVAAMACIYKGTAWVLGGVCDTDKDEGEITNTVENYDFASNRWHTKAPMACPRAFGSVVNICEALYLIGGVTIIWQSGRAVHTVLSTIDTYSENGGAEIIAMLDSPRCSASAAYHGNLLYIFGGRKSCGGEGLTNVQCYDVEQKQWVNAGQQMPIPLAGSLCIATVPTS